MKCCVGKQTGSWRKRDEQMNNYYYLVVLLKVKRQNH